MADNLFQDFDAVSSKQWKQQIQYELKGADYNDTLVWNSPEDIKVKPFYHKDESDSAANTIPSTNAFRICQDVFVYDVDKSIYRAKDSIKRGADSIRFIIEDKEIAIEKLLDSLDANITYYFKPGFLSTDFVKQIDKFAQARSLKVYCSCDPIGQLAADGNWFVTSERDNFETLTRLAAETTSIPFIGVNASLYHNAGANIPQQLAYTLAHANEYFNRFSGLSKPIVFEVAVGSNYFFEIAKLRALRLLFKTVATAYGHDLDCQLFVTPGRRNKTLYDYNVNMLRTTTECMSAILGGADTISNLPYDALYHKSNEFGERISRNQLLVLKHESYFDKVGNAPEGSYYIESLTTQLAEKALVIFKEIEAAGGFIKQLQEGSIQKKINESAAKEQQLFDSGKEVLLGTNKYPNKNDRMNGELELFPFLKVNPRKTLITPIIPKRLSEQNEQQRLQTEK